MQTAVIMKPLLLAMKGHPATGKSTLAESLSSSLKWPLIDKDDARDCLSMLLQEPVPQDIHSLKKRLNALSYDIMFRIAETQLKIGLGVVVVCPLAWPWLFKQCHTIASRNGVEMVVLECVCGDEELWKRRLEGRAQSALDVRECSVQNREATAEDVKRKEWADGLRSIFDVGADVWWHKPGKWEDLKRSIDSYGDWCNYDLGSVKKLVVDTSSVHSASAVLDWLRENAED